MSDLCASSDNLSSNPSSVPHSSGLQFNMDPLVHADHPHTRECHSLECLKRHCLHLETIRGSDDLICTPTSPCSASPTSTRSGTSPGYANDWAERQEKLCIHANEPSRERGDRDVKQLHDASLFPMTTEPATEAVGSQLPSTNSGSGLPPIPTTTVASKLLQRRQQRKMELAAQQLPNS